MSYDNRTLEGMIKAWGMIAQSNSQRTTKPRYKIEPAGSCVHARHCLTADERAKAVAAMKAVQYAETESEKDQRMAELMRLPVKLVPFKYAERIERSRYSGADLRAIRAKNGCGRPPKSDIVATAIAAE